MVGRVGSTEWHKIEVLYVYRCWVNMILGLDVEEEEGEGSSGRIAQSGNSLSKERDEVCVTEKSRKIRGKGWEQGSSGNSGNRDRWTDGRTRTDPVEMRDHWSFFFNFLSLTLYTVFSLI